jgi:cytochrome c oxidase subunit II
MSRFLPQAASAHAADIDMVMTLVALWIEIGVVAAEAAILVGLALPMWFARVTPAAMASPSGATVVRIVAEQFAWNIHYPGPDGEFGITTPARVSATNPLGLDAGSPGAADDVIVLNQLHVPIGRPVMIQLSSKDVIHSFGVPAMRVKQDAVPGVVTHVAFTPTLPGSFDVICSQLCGLAHFRMRAQVTVESDDAFEKFLRDERR